MDLLKRYNPILKFDSRELYFPSTVEYYLAHARGYNREQKQIFHKAEVGTEELGGRLQTLKELNLRVPDMDGSSPCAFGFTNESDIANAPVYASVVGMEERWLLQYVYFFPYTPSQYTCCLPTSPPAQATFHFVHLLVDRFSGQLTHIYFNGSQQWYETDEVEMWNDHVILYSDLFNHHFYPHPNAKSWMGFTVFDDLQHDDGGLMWCSQFIEELMDCNQEQDQQKTPSSHWNSFQGTFGDGTVTPLHQPWWLTPQF